MLSCYVVTLLRHFVFEGSVERTTRPRPYSVCMSSCTVPTTAAAAAVGLSDCADGGREMVRELRPVPPARPPSRCVSSFIIHLQKRRRREREEERKRESRWQLAGEAAFHRWLRIGRERAESVGFRSSSGAVARVFTLWSMAAAD